MRPNNFHLSISPSSLSSNGSSTSSFSRPLTPGCPTDSNLYHQQRDHRVSLQTPLSAFMTIPRTATTMTRQPSLVPGPTVAFGTHEQGNVLRRVEQWRIQPGAFIVFALDTELIAERLEANWYPDVQGDAAVQYVMAFPKGRYLGLVLWSHTYTVDGSHDHQLDVMSDVQLGAEEEVVEELIVNFVAPTLPSAPLQSHCVPIAPCTTIPVPSSQSGSSQAPLRTTTLFPFPGLFQWTTLGTRLEVRSVHDSALHFKLKEDEFERLDERIAEDFREAGGWMSEGCTDELVDRLKVPAYTLPAKIWKDVREAGRASSQGCKETRNANVMHPTSFVDEVEALTRFVAGCDTTSWNEIN